MFESKAVQVPLNQSRTKWLALFLMNMSLIGNYYCFDNPQALETHLTKIMSLSSTQYNLLYSIIAYPNIILPFIGGYITDKWGVRFSLTIFQSFVTIGQGIFTAGIYLQSYPLLLLGRLIFGVGCDNQSVDEWALVAKWFRYDNIALSLALQDTMFGASEALNSFVTPKIGGDNGDITAPAFVGLMICLGSQLLLFPLLILDKKNDDIVEQNKLVTEKLEYHNIRWSDIKNFKFMFWLIAFYYAITGVTFFTFTNDANTYLHDRFNFSTIDAGNLIAIVYIFNAFATPLGGWFVDKTGKRLTLMIIATIFGIISLGVLLYWPECDMCYSVLVPLCLLGLFFSFADAGCNPSLLLVVDKDHVGTGFGMFYFLQNVLYSFIPLVFGFLKDSGGSNGGYTNTGILLVSMAGLSFLEAVYIWYKNRKDNGLLQEVAREKQL